MNKKIYGVTGIVLFLVFSIGAGRYFLSRESATPRQPSNMIDRQNINSNEIDTSDWETFRNQKFGYEFMYPNGVRIDGEPELERVVGIEEYLGVPDNLMNEREVVGGLFGSGMLLLVIVEPANNPSQSSLKDWVWENIHEQKQAPYPELEKDIIFAGEPAYYAEYDRGVYSENGLYKEIVYSIFILHKNNIYRINAINLPPNPSEKWRNHAYYSYIKKYIPISEAIISSFKFTDTN